MIYPVFLIDFDSHPSRPSSNQESKNAYLFSGVILAAALALGTTAFAIPARSASFWPVFSFTREAEASPSPIVPDGKLKLLAAATNQNPNREKGGCELPTSGSALMGDSCPDTLYVENAKGGGSISLYVVREGDTLSEIADMYDVSSNTILWANDLKSAKDIHPGDSLVILPVTGLRHKVLKGETLASLAKTYGGDPEEIASFNGLSGDSALVVGTTVIIPGGEVKAVPKKLPSGSASGITQGGSLTQVKAKAGGPALPGFYGNPVVGAIVTQGIHGWNGVDLGARTGTPVYAAAKGTVIIARASGWNGGYGSYVVVDHGNGTQSLYSHLSAVSVSVGSSVERGTLVGAVGATGQATGPHLHFEVRGAQNPFAACSVGRSCNPQ